MSDLTAYGTVIDGLREQSQLCKVRGQTLHLFIYLYILPMAGDNTIDYQVPYKVYHPNPTLYCNKY